MPLINYEEAGQFSRPPSNLADACATASIRRVVQAFVTNVGRARAIWEVNPFLLELSFTHLSSIYETLYELTGHVKLTEAEKKDTELQERVTGKIARDLQEKIFKLGVDPALAVGLDVRRGAQRTDQLCGEWPVLQRGLLDTLAAQLLQVWTAFETLSADLWVEAVNERPEQLVKKFASTEGKNQEKSIALSAIRRAKFDLSKSMGAILRDTEKASFASVSSTKEAYRKAFGPADDIFDTPLRVLELTRNVLAHRAGVVDQQFIDDIGSARHPFGTLQIGKDLPLTGEIVRDLCTVGVNHGVKLVGFVDEWMSKNPS